MSEPQSRREYIRNIATKATEDANPSRWFEQVYTTAEGEADAIPWALMQPNPHLLAWLDQRGPNSSQRALVVGCGLGDDAEALAEQGYQVTAFDISPTAIAWCKERFPNSSVNYQVADLFEFAQTHSQAFDLVFECRTIQALPLKVRQPTLRAICQFLAPNGTLFLITNIREDEAEPDGPPWPLSESELQQISQHGLQEVQRHRPSGTNRPTLCLEYQRTS
ncbi:MAG: Thiopurine S-methyltransferase (TPMT) [Phormidium sp. OSCR]|nr:MAG: Thiopurine S-methyltransferase (TPMT) [Phormidium sp. OSCR]